MPKANTPIPSIVQSLSRRTICSAISLNFRDSSVIGYLIPPYLRRIAAKSFPRVPKLNFISGADSTYSMAVATPASPKRGLASLSYGEFSNEEVSPFRRKARLILPVLTKEDIVQRPFTQPEHPWFMSTDIQFSENPSLS